MTVRELVALLGQHNPDANVWTYIDNDMPYYFAPAVHVVDADCLDGKPGGDPRKLGDVEIL